MAQHYEINPDQRGLALRVANRALRVANGLATARPGNVFIPNKGDDGMTDGTGTWIGSGDVGNGGVAPWIGDTTPPGKPTGITCSSAWGTLYVNWDGTLEGGVPADFAYVSVLVDGAEIARMVEAGTAVREDLENGTTVQVTAVAYDAARDRNGNPAPNASEAFGPVSVQISDERAEIDAEVEEIKGEMEQAAQDAADAKEAAAEASSKADAAADKADSYQSQIDDVTATVNGVEQEVAGFSSQIQGAVEDASQALTAATEASQDLAGFKTTVSQTYETKADADAAMAQEVLDRNSAIEQSAGEILSTVSQNYVDNETGETLATKAEVSQTASQIKQEVSEEYQVKGDYLTEDEAASSYASKSELTQTADSIKAEVELNSALLLDGEGGVVSIPENAGMPPRTVKVKGVTRQNLWVNPSGSNRGVSVSSNTGGTITVSGTLTSTEFGVFTTKQYLLKPSTQYTFSVDRVPSNFYFLVCPGTANGNSASIATLGGGGSDNNVTFTTPASLEYGVVFYVYRTDATVGTTVSGTYRVMLNEGSEAELWCPPGLNSVEELAIVVSTTDSADDGTTTPIDLDGHTLNSLPDGTRDELTIDATGAVTLTKRTQTVQLDDRGNWGQQESPFRHYTALWTAFGGSNTGLSPSGGVLDGRCDKLLADNTMPNGIYSASVNGSIAYLREPTFASDAAGVKEWMSTNKPTVILQLLEPKTIPLPAVTLPALPGSTANVWAVATDGHGNTFTLQPEIYVEWYAKNAAALTGFASKAELKVTADSIRAEVEETYQSKDGMSDYATNSSVTQMANSIKQEVAAEYTTKEDAEATYATKTSLQQTENSILSSVESEYQSKDGMSSYATKSYVDQQDSSIKSTVSSVQTTANNALSKASTVEQTAEGLEVRLTQAEKDVDTAQSTANTAKTNAATANTTATNAAKTATNYLKFDSSGLCVGNMTASTLSYNTLITSTGLHIRNGTADLASFEVGTIDLGGIPIEDAGTQGVLNSKINFAGGSLDSKTYTTSGGRAETQLRLYESRGLSDLMLTADTALLGGPGVTLRADTGQILLSPTIGSVYKKSTNYEMFAARRLYYNRSGTTGNVTLPESAANFPFLDIFFMNNDNYRDYVRVYAPNGNSAVLSNSVYKNEYTTTYVRNKVVTISGTSISVVSNRNGEGQVRQNNNCYAEGATSVIKIYAVWGWK